MSSLQTIKETDLVPQEITIDEFSSDEDEGFIQNGCEQSTDEDVIEKTPKICQIIPKVASLMPKTFYDSQLHLDDEEYEEMGESELTTKKKSKELDLTEVAELRIVRKSVEKLEKLNRSAPGKTRVQELIEMFETYAYKN